ncbi:pyridoxamine 5'-phosphate oxidase family protein [Sulfurimonas sp. MAG313]|nr:pyridoxamine 5'-phosphate oxidase family protein [Sulfurimonas sp. MAG313]MDF1881830.1 pyridoxamine 5'-phosphate oxidase family protein [Sulfurimonas sp. MAG313]
MEFFTEEHIEVRKKYKTNDEANHWLNSIDTTYLNEFMITFIESMPYFFFATSSSNGNTNVNFKGSEGNTLVKVLSKNKLIFADYKGNGILHSVGDISSNPKVGMLFVDFNKDFRLKISGRAKVIDNELALNQYLDVFETFEMMRLIEVEIEYVIPNCSNKLSIVRQSILKENKEKI